MKSLVMLLLLLISSISFAEFGKVVDKEGYVNVRNKASLSGKVVGKLSSGAFVYVHDEDMYNNWLYSYPSHDSTDLSGYIHKSRVAFINQNDDGLSTKILMSSFNQSESEIQFSSEDKNVSVTIQAEDFDYSTNKNKFTKKYVPESWGDSFYLTHYKGQSFWGTDGSEPVNTNHYKSITVTIGNRTIDIPKNEIESLFNIDLRRTRVYFDVKTDSVYISASEGDGAGSYQILFAIENGRYVGKTVLIPH